MRLTTRILAAMAAALTVLLCGCSAAGTVTSPPPAPAHDADTSQNVQTAERDVRAESAANDEPSGTAGKAERGNAPSQPDEDAHAAPEALSETAADRALLALALNADFADCGIAEEDTPLLREFLSVFLSCDAPSVLPQTPDDFDTERIFYEIKNALTLLLREAQQDAALEQALCERETWHLTREDAFSYVLRAEGETALTVQLYLSTQCVSAEGFETPSLLRLRQQAADGENADAVSGEMRERFVQYLMRDDAYGWLFTGFEDSTSWQWSTENSQIVLTLRCYPNGAAGAATELILEANPAGAVSERPIG